ncbi:MAG: hypothetical protein LBU46_02175 [Candidatus Accumulibacter sp.]|nr:hypothetical protein [Accumulibacter sp.]
MKRIVSAVPGRLRVRDSRLSERAVAQYVIDSTARKLPVLEARANPAACSVIIQYDAQAIPLAEMRQRTEDVLAACLSSQNGENPPKKRRRSARMRFNRYAKLGALASLAASLAFAYSGSRRLHVVTGWVFVACLCAHLAVFQRALLR